jgi:ssDNA-binding Zn-finger/Zn-ribbon topoisomerase 1
MPIKDKSLYPDNWEEISQRIKTEADWKCEQCGAAHLAVGFRDGAGIFHAYSEGLQGEIEMMAAEDQGHKSIQIILTTAHLDQDPGNNKRSNLRALCQKCHLDHDRPFNIKKAAKTRRQKKYGTHHNQAKLNL